MNCTIELNFKKKRILCGSFFGSEGTTTKNNNIESTAKEMLFKDKPFKPLINYLSRPRSRQDSKSQSEFKSQILEYHLAATINFFCCCEGRLPYYITFRRFVCSSLLRHIEKSNVFLAT